MYLLLIGLIALGLGVAVSAMLLPSHPHPF